MQNLENKKLVRTPSPEAGRIATFVAWATAGLGTLALGGNAINNMRKQAQAEHIHNTCVEFCERGLVAQNIQANPDTNFQTIQNEPKHIFKLKNAKRLLEGMRYLKELGYSSIEAVATGTDIYIVAAVTPQVSKAIDEGIYRNCKNY